jgi:hypothetical protein
MADYVRGPAATREVTRRRSVLMLPTLQEVTAADSGVILIHGDSS